MKCFKNRDVITHLAQVAGTGQAGRAGPDNRYTVAVGGRNFNRRFILFRIVNVRNITFKTPDCDTFSLFPADAFAFALFFLRADAAAHCGKRICGSENIISRIQIPFRYLCNKFRDADRYRAAGHTERIAAVQAAVCFGSGKFCCVSKGNFFKVTSTDLRILLWHRILLQAHISHGFFSLLSFCRCALPLHPAHPCRKQLS